MAGERSQESVRTAEADLHLISFVVGPESFAIDIMAVSQIIRYQGSTRVPKAPEFIEGIIVLRDEVIPILDLRQRLFPEMGEAEGRKMVLILRLAGALIGVKVDGVKRIIRVPSESVMPAPRLMHGVAGEFLTGVVRYENGVLLLVDADRLLSPGEVSLLEELENADA